MTAPRPAFVRSMLDGFRRLPFSPVDVTTWDDGGWRVTAGRLFQVQDTPHTATKMACLGTSDLRMFIETTAPSTARGRIARLILALRGVVV